MVKMKEVVRKEMQIRAEWSDPRVLDVIVADELQLQDVGDRCYLTFGQVRLPIISEEMDENATGVIQSVVRLVVTKKALLEMLKALSRVSDTVRDDSPEVK
ncbi:hypothetical protein BH11GEM1_BH11GEM1_23210 [soil metagenome]